MNKYTEQFYQRQMEDSQRSASRVLPVAFSYYTPRSVIDVGCGVGTWLAECVKLGVTDVTGIDGDWVPRAMLRIPATNFRALDLRTFHADDIGRRFDMAICVEVAECFAAQHGPAFIQQLTRLAPVILFSAAVPLQGGLDHQHEEWLEYWASLFRACGFYPADCLRRRIWHDSAICWWYRQNILMFARGDIFSRVFPGFDPDSPAVSIVHPALYLWACARPNLPMNYDRYLADYERIVLEYKAGQRAIAIARPPASSAQGLRKGVLALWQAVRGK